MISQEYLKSLISYDPETGDIYWLSSGSGRNLSKPAGTLKAGYRRVEIDGRKYYAHVLIWLYMTGEWPDKQVDHWDLNRSNNCWGNLRLASYSQNQANTRPRGAVPLKGVSKKRGKFLAQMTVCGLHFRLGVFDTAEEAHAVYTKAAEQAFGQYVRLS